MRGRVPPERLALALVVIAMRLIAFRPQAAGLADDAGVLGRAPDVLLDSDGSLASLIDGGIDLAGLVTGDKAGAFFGNAADVL